MRLVRRFRLIGMDSVHRQGSTGFTVFWCLLVHRGPVFLWDLFSLSVVMGYLSIELAGGWIHFFVHISQVQHKSCGSIAVCDAFVNDWSW